MKTNKYLFLALVFLAACNSDDESNENPPVGDSSNLVLIGNEGGFGAVNASLTSIDEASGEVNQNLYSAANDNAVLGDVFQSISETNGELYFVVNNSEKVEVVDAQNFSSTRIIPIAEGSPRYMHHISDERAYVTDLFGGGIHEVNPTAGTYTGFVEMSMNTEHIVPTGGEVAVSEAFGSRIEFIDPATSASTGMLTLSAGLNGLKTDAQGNLWAYCAGDGFAAPEIPAKLYKIDPVAKVKTDSLIFDSPGPYASVGLGISPNGNKLYCLGAASVMEVDIAGDSPVASEFYENVDITFYSIHVAPVSGEVVVADAKDYSQPGEVVFLNADGSEKATYNTGVVPNAVHWLGN